MKLKVVFDLDYTDRQKLKQMLGKKTRISSDDYRDALKEIVQNRLSSKSKSVSRDTQNAR